MKIHGLRVLALCLALVPVALPAQENPTLDAVESLASAGRAEEARAALLTWWDEVRDDASRRDVQRAFWLRGRLTVDPVQAELDFQRLVIEYPGGPYSDLALLRLAQGAFAVGDAATAEAHVTRLVQEYPGSPVRREAQAWFATAGPPPERAERAPPIEPPDRPTVAEAHPPDSSVAPEGEAPVPDAEPSGIFAVQLGAFASEVRARSVEQQATDAGFPARLVRVEGSRLLHVRVGRFDTSADAEAILHRLRELGFTAAVVRNAHREERVGR